MEFIFFLFLALSCVFIFWGVRTKRYRQRISQIKPEPKSLSIWTAIVAAPTSFVLYAIFLALLGFEQANPNSPTVLVIVLGFFFTFVVTWRIIAALTKKILKIPS